MSVATLVDLLRRRARERPHLDAYTFLTDGETESDRLSYGELDTKARGVAERLRTLAAEGDRALLLYPSGLDFIVAFFGCLYAGVTAVPAYPPRRHKVQSRLRSIVADCRPVVCLTTAEVAGRADILCRQSEALAEVRWLATDTLTSDAAEAAALADAWRAPAIGPESLAFLQYTSGSTGSPKGVMVRHANLLHNEEMIRLAFGQDEDSVVVGWLPLYHDMGLIGNVLQPLYAGARCVLMSPMAMLQKPLRWLAAIDRYRGTTSGGPNFAYELCVERVAGAERAGLDLSSWRVAFNGAEPVRAATLERFADAFAPRGFRREAFYPCYGLAETTLFVTGGEPSRTPRVGQFDAGALEHHRAMAVDGGREEARSLVGCGRAWLGQEVAIVDPESRRRRGEGAVGEIWVAGPSVAEGYWGRPELSRRDFAARLEDEPAAGPFLRTGDLGFIDAGELFVTGRCKDLIIVRGRNLYPHDLEHTAERCHPALRAGGGAAFAVDARGEERLVLVLEVERRIVREKDPAAAERIAETVRRAVAEDHEVAVEAVVLIHPGTLPKTSSGKVRRTTSRERYLEGELRTVGHSLLSAAAGAEGQLLDRGGEADGDPRLDSRILLALAPDDRRKVLLGHLRRGVARLLAMPAARVEPGRPLTALGLDSLHAMELRGRLEGELGRAPDFSGLLEGASLEDLAEELLEGLGDEAEPAIPTAGDALGEHPPSYGQRALWFLHRLAPESAAYNIAAAARIRGALDTEALRRAFVRLVERHAVLRARFRDPHGELRQEIPPPGGGRFVFHVEAAAGWNGARAAKRFAAEAHRPFDLASGPLLRVLVLERGGEEHDLLLVVHHIVADFWSIAVLLEELGELYRDEAGGAAAALPPLAHTYADFARWQRQRLADEDGQRLERFWLEALAGGPEPLDLASDRPRPPVQTWNGAAASTILPAAAAQALGQLGRELGATLYMTLLAGFTTLLYRYTGQDDIAVGSPASGRVRPELEGLVGYFVNPLVMRGDLAGNPSWSVLLGRTRQRVLDALRQQEYPFDLLVERLHPERELSRPPIFQVFFTLHQAPRLRAEGLGAEGLGAEGLNAFALGRGGARLVLGGLEWESLPLANRSAQFELALAAAVLPSPASPREGAAPAGKAGGLSLTLTYNRDLFEPATAERILGHLQRILAAAAEAPGTRLGALDLLTPEERRQVLADGNDTRREIPRHAGVHELVEAQARRTPDAAALVCGEVELTYRELVRRAGSLARRLRELGAGDELPMGLFLERSPEMVVGLLGILEAGGCYVPLDPSYPEDRLRFMFEDASRGRGHRLLVTREADCGRLGDLASIATRVVTVDGGDDGESGDRASSARKSGDRASGDGNGGEAAAVPRSKSLAYVIYTSGSTGRPKGVAIPHRAVVNFLESMRREPGLHRGDALLAVTTLAFDIAVLEIFLPLAVGARLVLADRESAADGARLGEEILRHGITVMQATPATWRLVLESGRAAAAGLVMLCGGEALPSDVAAGLLDARGVLWNMYGPTETTVWSAVRRVSVGEAPVGVGGAIANTCLYVLDERLEAAPLGVPGEMWIGGEGLARGYRGRPRLTAERFVADPFAADPGGRLYRVGDRVRRREDATFEFLSRVDHQVKVRGYRIELGEIESALVRHPAVAQAVVVVRADDPADPRLAAYLTAAPAAGDAGAAPAELRGFLRRALPEYMVPSAFVTVDDFPRTPNGKIDRGELARRRLPTPGARAGERREPGSRLERVLAELWCEVLGIDSVGLDENFFDLGGHSLLAARLHRLLAERLGREDLSVVQLFQHPTVGSLARFLAAEERPAGPRTRRRAADLPGAEIAVVGMAGRFPGAGDVDAFWRHLRGGVEAITFFADEELDEVDPAERDDERYVRARGVLDGAEDFDAAFFGFTPREAEVMDPQHRLFLEVAHEALEDAGYDPGRYGGRIGLWAGVGMNTYLLHAGEEQLTALAGGYQAFIANDKDFVPTRVSYKLDLRGPSVNVQTACSSSLVAVHLACQSLRAGESEMALAGGVTVRLPQRRGYLYEAGGILSSDGHCRAFDEGAGGTVLGNGLAVVVLKPLEAARDDGDRVLAVIKGSAINNDGSLKMGYTAPSVEGQAEVIADALAQAGVEPGTVGYVEAHGTGTELGDPIEVAALSQVFTGGGDRTAPGRTAPCYLGSVKTNIGHLDTAAGVAGLVKTVLALDRGEIPPSLHFSRPNPKIPFADGPFRVAAELVPWPRGGEPRRAGVSSFGIGGTNAHLVLEEAPPLSPASPAAPWQLLLLSAKTRAALEVATRRLAEHLGERAARSDGSDGDPLADVAFTLQTGRQAHDHRRWVVADGLGDAARVLAEADPERVRTGVVGTGGRRARAGAAGLPPRGGLHEAGRRVVFLFSGQGAQYPGMGRGLYRAEPVFRAEIDRAAEALKGQLGVDLRALLFPDESDIEAHDEASARLRETRVTQPALFAVEHALARLWAAWGVEPAAMIGHSIGEFVAATLAGVFRFEDALALVSARGRLMQEQPAGAMLAVGLAEAEVLPLLGEELSLAAINGPRDSVVAGPEAAVAAFEERLGELGGGGEDDEGDEGGEEIRRSRLHTSHAFHSAMMAPAVEPFVRLVAELGPGEPRIPFVSNVSGTWITGAEATDPAYWGRHLVRGIRFADGLRTLADEREHGIFLEVGPGHTLATLARSQVRGRATIASLPHPRDGEEDGRFVLGALGRLWQAGAEIDWRSFYRGRGERRRRVSLPTYPFERRRFWLERREERPLGAPAARRALAKKADVGEWFYAPVWKPSHPASPPAAGEAQETWWVIGGGESPELFSARLTARLATGARRILTLVADAELGRRAAAFDTPPSRVVAAWATDAADVESEDGELGIAPLLALVQALAALPGEAPIGLDLVTRGLWPIAAGEASEPRGAILWGLLRTVTQELPRLRCRAVDLDPAEAGDPAALELAVEDLSVELASPVPAFAEVAWRGGLRWERNFEPFRLGEAGGAATRLRPGGTYLLTGGLGGVGLVLARGIVESLPPDDEGVRARLALLGRSALPPRETWHALLEEGAAGEGAAGEAVSGKAAAGEAAALRRRVRAVRELEAAGAEVMTVAADVAEREELSAALSVVRERFGPIRGVIHAAGVAGGGLLRLRKLEEAQEVLRPKVDGTRALWAALSGEPLSGEPLSGEPLDFVLFCSSINAVVGGYGQADYCAANAYLDAAAAARRRDRRGPLVVSLGWDRFRGVGMAAAGAGGHPLLGTAVLSTAEREIYRARFAVDEQWVLSEHLVAGRPTVPGATYLEMARAAFADRADGRPLEIRDVVFLEPLAVDAGTGREVLTVFDLERAGGGEAGPDAADSAASFRVLSRVPGTHTEPLGAGGTSGETPWSEHCRGRIAVVAPRPGPAVDLAEVRRRARGRITAEDAASRSSRGFLVTGRRWQGLESVRVGEGELLADIALAEDLAADLDTHPLHPALLDLAVGCVQLAREGDFLPLSYDRLRILGPLPRRLTSHLRLRGRAEDAVTCDALLVDEEGVPRAEVEGFSMRRLAAATLAELERTAADASAAEAVAGGPRRPEEVVLEGTVEPAEAVDVLRRVLASRVPPHLVVSPRDLGAVSAAYAAFDPSLLAAELAAADIPAAGQARPELGTDFVAPGEGLEKVVAEVWRRYLGIDAIGVNDNFFELGGTSLVGVQVVGELKRRLGREISTVSLFEAPTVAALARLLEPSAEPAAEFARTRSRAKKKKAALGKAIQSRGRRARRKR